MAGKNYYKKKDIDTTPIDFNKKLKTIDLLTKKRAHQFIAFQFEGRDEHFITMNFVSLKHLTIVDYHNILKPDYNDWVRYMKTKGWVVNEDIKGFMESLKK